MLESAREKHRPPPVAVVATQFEIVALSRHAGDDVADSGPGVEPAVEEAHLGRARFEREEAESGVQEARTLTQ